MNPTLRMLFLAVLVVSCGIPPLPPIRAGGGAIEAPPSLDPIVEVSVGTLAHCTRSQLGRVECEGSDFRFDVVEAGARAMSAGGMFGYCGQQTFGCALMDRRIVCASHGSHVCEPRRNEVRLEEVRAIAVGDHTACALLESGQVMCSEESLFEGKLHVIAGMDDSVAISCGGMTCCALAADGSVRCLGSGGNLSFAPGVVVPLPAPAVAVSVGYTHACALAADGRSSCWGTQGVMSVPMRGARVISAGLEATCALDALGFVECTRGNQTTAPFDVALVQMDLGYGEVCGLDASGNLRCANP